MKISKDHRQLLLITTIHGVAFLRGFKDTDRAYKTMKALTDAMIDPERQGEVFQFADEEDVMDHAGVALVKIPKFASRVGELSSVRLCSTEEIDLWNRIGSDYDDDDDDEGEAWKSGTK